MATRYIKPPVRLTTAISVIEVFNVVLMILFIAGVAASIIWLQGMWIALGIIGALLILGMAVSVQKQLIHHYLSRTNFPVEFISVLRKLGISTEIELMEDWINYRNDSWTEERTKQFIRENRLRVEIRSRRKFPLPDEDLSIPLIQFSEKGIAFSRSFIAWADIQKWKHRSGSENSSGKIILYYMNEQGAEEKKRIALDDSGMGRIECLLLLSHFKAKSEIAEEKLSSATI